MSALTIVGDSFGCGAWQNGRGPGDGYFTTKFEEYYKAVYNHCEPGCSNYDILNKIETVLLEETKLRFRSAFLVIQTDPIRTVLPFQSRALYMHDTDYYHVIKDDYKEFTDKLIDFFYFNLNNLAQEYNVIFNLSGGCSDIDVNLAQKYKNLNVACDSFYKILDSTHALSSASNTHVACIENSKNGAKDIVNGVSSKIRIQEEYQGRYFGEYPDVHPSRKGINLWIPEIQKRMKYR